MSTKKTPPNSPHTSSTARGGDDGPPDVNTVVIVGALSSDPVERELPSGDLVVTYEVTTRIGDGPAATVPVAWTSPPKRRPALATADRVVVSGHIRRRFFRAGGVTASRTEVVAARVARISDRALQRIAADLCGAADTCRRVDDR